MQNRLDEEANWQRSVSTLVFTDSIYDTLAPALESANDEQHVMAIMMSVKRQAIIKFIEWMGYEVNKSRNGFSIRIRYTLNMPKRTQSRLCRLYELLVYLSWSNGLTVEILGIIGNIQTYNAAKPYKQKKKTIENKRIYIVLTFLVLTFFGERVRKILFF